MTNYAQFGDAMFIKQDIGYDSHYPYEVKYASGPYTGGDDQWREVGIPSHVLQRIAKDSEKKGFKYGWTFKVENGVKTAIISFDNKNYAFWFRLRTRCNNNG